MTDTILVVSLGFLTVTVYGLLLSLAVSAGLLWVNFTARHILLPKDTAVRVGLWAIPLGLIGGRALFVAVRWSLVVNELGWQQIFRLWDGGFALFGVIPGCLLAVFLCARQLRLRTAELLDAVAPGAALTLAIMRFAEYFTPQGLGPPMDSTALHWFPLAIQNSYGEWMVPVFFWEGLAALMIAGLSARALYSPKRKPFNASSAWFLWLGATQVILESLRTDDLLRLGLVKVSQLAAMACVLGVAVRWAVLAYRAGKPGLKICAYCAGLLAGVGFCTAIEFALDKTPIPNAILYLGMGLALVGMVVLIGKLREMAVGKPALAE